MRTKATPAAPTKILKIGRLMPRCSKGEKRPADDIGKRGPYKKTAAQISN
jgi:hypothetical protein